jgi:hypothetical protein
MKLARSLFTALRLLVLGVICVSLLSSCAARRSMQGPHKTKHKRSKRQKCETCPFWRNDPIAEATFTAT